MLVMMLVSNNVHVLLSLNIIGFLSCTHFIMLYPGGLSRTTGNSYFELSVLRLIIPVYPFPNPSSALIVRSKSPCSPVRTVFFVSQFSYSIPHIFAVTY